MSDDLKNVEPVRARDTGSPPQTDSRLLETLLANAPDFVYFKDHERRFVCASRPFEVLLGRSESEILGKRDEDLFPAEVASQTAEDDRRVIEDGTSLVNRLEGTEDPDGRMVWVLTTKIPWRDVDGNVLGLFGISKDITDRFVGMGIRGFIQKPYEIAAMRSKIREAIEG
ncbi:MAG: PAS domain-containing protein [Gammaproteobacteria bacterium]|nr:PAS domain-containing protein [Gammaproteobacteria bacterium]